MFASWYVKSSPENNRDILVNIKFSYLCRVNGYEFKKALDQYQP